MNLTLLDSQQPQFPNPNLAVREPDGLLAVGGNLKPPTLLDAYQQGIFPWYQDDDPILWWSPSERCVIDMDGLHLSKSLRRTLRRQQYRVTTDQNFAAVLKACAAPRDGNTGTWITEEMAEAYMQLHLLGHAHSVEVWQSEQLVGGIYGVAVGDIFCGESMFSRVTDGSKIAMAYLCKALHQLGYKLLDCQLENSHLMSMGAYLMPREEFLAELQTGNSNTLGWPQAGTLRVNIE
jgi:leucyl/phenylalanyl-tRNA--protein transferase